MTRRPGDAMSWCAGCKAPLQKADREELLKVETDLFPQADDVFLVAPGDRRPFCGGCVDALVDLHKIAQRTQAGAERRMLERMRKETTP